MPKHRGLTFFICDMEADGVDVRPLRQADGTDAHFNEVFLTDVHLPDTLRVGGVGQGWAISVVGLRRTRRPGGLPPHHPDRRPAGRVGGPAEAPSPAEHAVLRDRVARLWIRSAAIDAMAQRMKEIQDRDGPKNEGALTKIASTELAQDVHELSVDILGPEGTLGGEYATMLSGTHVDSPSSASSGAGPCPSRAAPIRSCATSSASASWACPATSGSTSPSPGGRCRARSPGPASVRPDGCP